MTNEIVEAGIKRLEERAAEERVEAEVRKANPEPVAPSPERRNLAARELAVLLDKKARTLTGSYWGSMRGKVDAQMAICGIAAAIASWTTGFPDDQFKDVIATLETLTTQLRDSMIAQMKSGT